MSTFKKIGTVIVVLVLVTIYANIGHWFAKAYVNALYQTDPSTLDSFLSGPNMWFKGEVMPEKEFSIIVAIFWPIGMATVCGAWLVYLMFYGGLFKAIGLVPSILTVIAGAMIAWIWHVNHPKKMKPIKI
jgi:hypothetical protein